MAIVVFIFIIFLSIIFLRGFDKISGRGPQQIQKGIDSSQLVQNKDRVECPECAEMIMPKAKKCRFCGAIIKK